MADRVERRPAAGAPSGPDPRRIAAGFVVGSAAFAVGSCPLWAVDLEPRLAAGVFFAGSIFFTAAAAGQLRATPARPGPGDAPSVAGRSTAWWSAAVQLVGTLLFNVSTFFALFERLDATREERLVWAPDAFGSTAFLVSAALAWYAALGWRWAARPRDPSWWAVAVNALGCVLFGLAALGAWVSPSTGDELSLALVNGGTFLGALCFAAGAVLSLRSPP